MTEQTPLAEFWNDCQAAPELRLLVDRPPNLPKGVVLQTPFAVVGRDDACDIVVNSPDVSRRHLYLQVIGGELWSFDLASRTGLFLGEQRLQAATVTSTAGVRVGPCCLQPLADGDFTGAGDPDPLEPVREADDLLPTVTLEFKNATQLGGGPAPVWQLDRTITFVGQALQCKVRFKCPSVSRLHCALVRTRGGVWVVDLLGRKGISVNGSRVRFAKLNDGAELRVGRFRMTARASERSRQPRVYRAPATMLAMRPSDAAPSDVSQAQPTQVPAALVPSVVSLVHSELMISAPPPGSQQALAPSSPELPIPPGLDATQQMLLTMMHQFSTMQQQMFDQFQQTTMMMMQMFGSLQKDQFDLVRQELEGLRELNRELNMVQGELARRRGGSSEKPESSSSTELQTTRPQPAKPQTAKPKASRTGAGSGSRRKRQPAPGHGQAPQVEVPCSEMPPVDPASSESAAPAAPKRPATPGRPAAPDAADTASADVLSNATTPAGIDVPPGEDVHEWLCRRFADLQQERQTRWQRLMGVLTGK